MQKIRVADGWRILYRLNALYRLQLYLYVCFYNVAYFWQGCYIHHILWKFHTRMITLFSQVLPVLEWTHVKKIKVRNVFKQYRISSDKCIVAILVPSKENHMHFLAEVIFVRCLCKWAIMEEFAHWQFTLFAELLCSGLVGWWPLWRGWFKALEMIRSTNI